MSTDRFRVKFAVYLILRDDDKVLLSKRSSTGWKDGWYGVVAGHVQGGEPAELAMVREAREEVGIDIDVRVLKHVYTVHRLGNGLDDEYVDLFFECREWSGDIVNAEPEKCDELAWYGVDQLPDLTISHIRKVINEYGDGDTYSSELKES